MRKIKKSLALIGIAIMLFVGGLGVHVPQIQAATNKTVIFKGNVTAPVLNVRNSYHVNSKKIGSLKKNAIVEVISTTKGWNEIKYGKGYGWVSGSYIEKQQTVVNEANVALPVEVLFKGKVTAPTLNVRSAENEKSKRIGTLKRNSVVEVVGSSKGWYKIKYEKGYGWVLSSYIKKITNEIKPTNPDNGYGELPKDEQIGVNGDMSKAPQADGETKDSGIVLYP